MDLGDILSREQIITDLRATNRWEAIDELINNLVATGKIKAENQEAVAAVVKKRESSMSTGIGFGIGIPHASTDLISEVVGALGRPYAAMQGESLVRSLLRFRSGVVTVHPLSGQWTTERGVVMTPLRTRMLEDMQIRNLTRHTQVTYLQQVTQFEQRKTQLQERVALIERLRKGQSGPVHMLDELSKAVAAQERVATQARQKADAATSDKLTAEHVSLADTT